MFTTSIKSSMFPRRQVSSEQKFQRTAVIDCSCARQNGLMIQLTCGWTMCYPEPANICKINRLARVSNKRDVMHDDQKGSVFPLLNLSLVLFFVLRIFRTDRMKRFMTLAYPYIPPPPPPTLALRDIILWCHHPIILLPKQKVHEHQYFL